MAQPYLCAARPADGEARPPDHVLAHIEDEDARTKLLHRYRTQRLGDAHRLGQLRHQFAPGRIHRTRRRPGGIVEAGPRPVGELGARVVFLAVVFVVGADGSGGRELPRGIGYHLRGSAVGVLDVQLQPRLWVAEVARCNRHQLARRPVAAVAEDEPDRVLPRRQTAGDVVRHVKDALIVIGEIGLEDIVADLAAIEVQLEQAQSADVRRGPAHRAVQRELLAQVAGGQRPLLLVADLAPGLHAIRAEFFHRAVRRGPRARSDHARGFALLELERERRDQTGALPPWLRRNLNLVVAGLEETIDIPHHRRTHHTGASHPFAVDGELEAGVGGDHRLRALQLAVGRQHEGRAEGARSRSRRPDPPGVSQVAEGAGGVVIQRALVETDPLGLPVGSFQQAHRPLRGFAPRRGGALFVPHPHLPEDARAADQRLACVLDVDGIIGRDLAGIPQVSAPGGQRFGGGGGQHLPGGLAHAACRGVSRGQHPAQARDGHVDALWIDTVFAAQSAGTDLCGKRGCQEEESKREFHPSPKKLNYDHHVRY